MQTVAETAYYLRRAARVLSNDEQKSLVDLIAANPTCGVLLAGTGGLRKLRVARTGGGKSGGARVIYYFFSGSAPIFLLDIFAKGDKENLTQAERNALAQVARRIASMYGD